jgi:hypothetical protein
MACPGATPPKQAVALENQVWAREYWSVVEILTGMFSTSRHKIQIFVDPGRLFGWYGVFLAKPT